MAEEEWNTEVVDVWVGVGSFGVGIVGEGEAVVSYHYDEGFVGDAAFFEHVSDLSEPIVTVFDGIQVLVHVAMVPTSNVLFLRPECLGSVPWVMGGGCDMAQIQSGAV